MVMTIAKMVPMTVVIMKTRIKKVITTKKNAKVLVTTKKKRRNRRELNTIN